MNPGGGEERAAVLFLSPAREERTSHSGSLFRVFSVFRGSYMPDQATLNHAAQILAAVASGERADTALRFYFESHRYLQPPAKRVISHTVFVYFRWLTWLDPKASPQKRLEEAVELHERFTANPKSIKAQTLAGRAAPP